MAVFTELTLTDASIITEAHGLGPTTALEPIAAGSVNTNYFAVGEFGKRFLRVYEEQDSTGVAYEWALLDHLESANVPVAKRVRGPAPGAIRIGGKPTALFELVHGRELRQREVTPRAAEEVGRALGLTHRAVANFGWRREGRFRRSDLRGRLDFAEAQSRPELEAPVAQLRSVLDELDRSEPSGLPVGVTHGDLFRDNVRFEGESIAALIDWESAADGVLLYDLAVTVLAWCYGDSFDWDLARAMVGAYDRERALTDAEWGAFRFHARAAAARFATTRITDFHLRSGGVGERTHRDFRRFLARLDAVSALDADAVASRLR